MNDENSPYKNVRVLKVECINHIKKQLSARLRKLGDEEAINITTKTGNEEKPSKWEEPTV